MTNESDKRRRKRRRVRRASIIGGFLLLSTGLAWFFESQATTTVIFVRYADIAEEDEFNPGLSPAGQRRAEELVRVLGDVDVVAGVDTILATETRRTQETVAPLAEHLGVAVHPVAPDKVKQIAERILLDFKGKIVLVVTEPDAIPPLIEEFHGSKKLPPMGESEHDNLYIVTIPWFGKVKTLRLKYGAPYLP